VVVGCGNSARVVAFDVEPRTACPGDSVTVTWEVVGGAKLAIVTGTKDPQPDQVTAAEATVASKDHRVVPVTENTTFVITAVDANQAKDPWRGSQPVDVPTSDEPRGVTTSCSGPTCTGTFTLHAQPSARILRISNPTMKQGGQATPATVCVTHGSLANTCIEAGKSIDVSVPADGAWQLSTTMADGSQPASPPGLSVDVHIGCP
jgi:hypothetical protein